MLAELVGLVTAGTISRNRAKDVLLESMQEMKWPRDIVEEHGYAQQSDEGEIAAMVDRVLAENASVVDEYRAGDDKAKKQKKGFLMGQLRKADSSANPQIVARLLDERLA
jgi:aspartyl-tRNA(Asn)/glutamyl-tRNA(Gln) amidotransferase subunit B